MKHKLLACALALATTPALADEVGQWYINPQVGYLITDHDRVRDNNWLYGIGVGTNLTDHFSLEVNGNNTQLYRGGAHSIDLSAISLDALWYPNRSWRVAPYLVLGVGAISDQYRPAPIPTDKSVMYEGGLGLRALLWESADKSRSFSLRPEVKARYDEASLPGHFTDYIGMLGFQYGFGSAPAAAPKAQAAPPPPPVAAPPPPPPPGDEDHDGVPDNLDRCPGTAPGVMVDIYGCEQKGAILLEGVTFEFNSATLTSESKPVLDKVAAGLKAHRRVKVELQGHTDSKGKDAYNQKLSERRADSVRSYLVDQGVQSSQLTSKGYGETKPVADNTSEEGRAKNRRVVMQVLDNPRDVDVKGEGKAEETAR